MSHNHNKHHMNALLTNSVMNETLRTSHKYTELEETLVKCIYLLQRPPAYIIFSFAC